MEKDIIELQKEVVNPTPGASPGVGISKENSGMELPSFAVSSSGYVC